MSKALKEAETVEDIAKLYADRQQVLEYGGQDLHARLQALSHRAIDELQAMLDDPELAGLKGKKLKLQVIMGILEHGNEKPGRKKELTPGAMPDAELKARTAKIMAAEQAKALPEGKK